jgi:MFS family permease
MFLICGIVFATWVSQIPQFQDRFNLSEGALGVILLAGSAGTLSMLAAASGLIARFGSRAMTLAGSSALSLLLPLIALAPHPILLWIALYAFGASMSLMDVSMNAQGVEVEQRKGSPVMSSFHAAFSIGGFIGAAAGAWMVSLDATLLLHFAGVGLLCLIAVGLASRALLHIEHEVRSGGSVFQIPARALWALGLVALLSSLGEGAMADWGAVYLTEIVRTTASFAALGYAAFSILMTVGRLSGDWLTAHLSRPMLVGVGAGIAGLGLTAALLIPAPGVALVGFALVGLGLANVIPLVFSAAARVPGIGSSRGIAGVATIGYGGFLAGPPLIGLVAEVTSLRFGLALVAAGIVLITVLARSVGGRAAAG